MEEGVEDGEADGVIVAVVEATLIEVKDAKLDMLFVEDSVRITVEVALGLASGVDVGLSMYTDSAPYTSTPIESAWAAWFNTTDKSGSCIFNNADNTLGLGTAAPSDLSVGPTYEKKVEGRDLPTASLKHQPSSLSHSSLL
jgi:hypothetical protein